MQICTSNILCTSYLLCTSKCVLERLCAQDSIGSTFFLSSYPKYSCAVVSGGKVMSRFNDSKVKIWSNCPSDMNSNQKMLTKYQINHSGLTQVHSINPAVWFVLPQSFRLWTWARSKQKWSLNIGGKIPL